MTDPDPTKPNTEQGGEEALQSSLTELNRRLRTLKEDLTAGATGAAQALAPGAGAPPAAPSAAAPELGPEPAPAPQAPPLSPAQPYFDAPPPPDPEQRANDILGNAQRLADEIMRNARRQVAATPPVPPSFPGELADAVGEAAKALRYTQNLLHLGEELLASSHGVLEAIEQDARKAQASVAQQTQVAWPGPMAPPPPPPAPPYPYPGHVSVPAPPPTPAPAPSPPPPAEEEAPAAPISHQGVVTLTAGPLTDVAAAAVLERALGHVPAITRARVKRFVDDRAVIELTVAEPVTLADELRRVLPYPFEVQAITRSQLDIAIPATSDSNGNGASSSTDGGSGGS